MKKIVFMGTPDFSVPILKMLAQSSYDIVLVVTQPDRPKGRKKVLTAPPVKEEAKKQQIPVYQPTNIKSQTDEILKYKPDLIITAAYGQILPKKLLEAPPFGCINVHASILPELRGGAPIHYAILEGKKETGITIMYMDEKLDAGDILTQEKITIEQSDDVGTLHQKLSILGAKLLKETLPKLFDQQLKPIKQDDSKATYAPNITREQEKIDWSKDQVHVYNHIRGLHPWPVAFTSLNGKRLKIWNAEIDKNDYPQASPGEVVHISNSQSFSVACGNQKAIKITEVQPEGKTKMAAKQFLNGGQIKLGTILGD